jgi:hypothetical protein
MARLTADQWESVRAEREAGKSFAELSRQYGVSRQAIMKRSSKEGWGDGTDVNRIIRRKVAEKVTGIVTGCNRKKKAEALEDAAAKGVAIVLRHQRDWEAHHNSYTVDGIAKDFEIGKSAKICAEMLAIRQKAERAAHGLEEVPSLELPAELHVKLVSANGKTA